jgi:tetratricopeptide (TPR) repeat protein
MAKCVVGRLAESLKDLEDLDREDRLGMGNILVLGSLQIETEQFEMALQTAERMKAMSDELGIPEALASRALRRLGRLDDARQHAARALELKPDLGGLWAAAAGIEIELRNYDLARDYLRRAEDLEPGTPQELGESARLALRTEAPEVAKCKLQRAIAAYEANPLMLRQSEVRALRSLLIALVDVQESDDSIAVASPTHQTEAEPVSAEVGTRTTAD